MSLWVPPCCTNPGTGENVICTMALVLPAILRFSGCCFNPEGGCAQMFITRVGSHVAVILKIIGHPSVWTNVSHNDSYL